MMNEIHDYYDIPRDRISICGAAHFDAHVQAVDRAVVEATLDSLGLDPEQPYLFFGMSSPYFAPHEIDIIEWLAGAIRKNVFGPSLQLAVRPHPQNVSGNMADPTWLPRLEALRGERVGIDYPSLQEESVALEHHRRGLAQARRLAGRVQHLPEFGLYPLPRRYDPR